MDIKEIISKIKTQDYGIKRIVYEPYNPAKAQDVIEEIGKKIIPEFEINQYNIALYHEIIMYVHADSDYKGELTKGIAITGATGLGKTKAMEIMSLYSEIDEVRYIKDGKQIRLKFPIYNSREMVDAYAKDGLDGIHKYTTFTNLCIDDLGTENMNANHYGTKLNVIEEIIEERYRKNLLTHLTSNLTEEDLHEAYGDRVYSRLKSMVNYHNLTGQDFRK